MTNRSQKWGAPVLEAPHGRRDDFIDPYFKRAKPDQVVAILRAREPARILIAIGNKKDDRWHLQFTQRWVIHYNFYVNDARWGRMFVRLCPYLPFSARVCLNQHHWLAGRMREENIDFQQCTNAFLKCADPQRLQELADSLTANDLLTCGQKWLACFTPFFTENERKNHGCQHRLFFAQVEYCDNLIFHRRAALDALGQRLLDANRTIGQPNKITIIFGRKVTKHYRGKLQTVIEDIDLPNPVIRSHYGQGFIKQYVRDHLLICAPNRPPTMSPTMAARKPWRICPNSDRRCPPSSTTITTSSRTFWRPSSIAGSCASWPSPRFCQRQTDPRPETGPSPATGAVCTPWSALATSPRRTRSPPAICINRAEALGVASDNYSLASLRYDLSKLRAKGFVEKLPHTRRYRLTREGYSVCLVFLKLSSASTPPSPPGCCNRFPATANSNTRSVLNSTASINALLTISTSSCLWSASRLPPKLPDNENKILVSLA